MLKYCQTVTPWLLIMYLFTKFHYSITIDAFLIINFNPILNVININSYCVIPSGLCDNLVATPPPQTTTTRRPRTTPPATTSSQPDVAVTDFSSLPPANMPELTRRANNFLKDDVS